jgi:tetratricopeptide (TPR) repeat protein
MGIYFSLAGQFELSEMFFLENIRRTQGRYYESFYNLGGLYFGAKRIDEAKLCITRLLEKVPRETLARQIRANYMRP